MSKITFSDFLMIFFDFWKKIKKMIEIVWNRPKKYRGVCKKIKNGERQKPPSRPKSSYWTSLSMKNIMALSGQAASVQTGGGAALPRITCHMVLIRPWLPSRPVGNIWIPLFPKWLSFVKIMLSFWPKDLILIKFREKYRLFLKNSSIVICALWNICKIEDSGYFYDNQMGWIIIYCTGWVF